MKLSTTLASCLAAAALVAPANVLFAAPAAADAASQQTILKAVTPSLVRVESPLQFDKGEGPQRRLPGQGRRGAAAGAELTDLDQLIEDERPWEVGAFLIAPRRVVLTDPMIHPRFIQKILVRSGDKTVTAKPAAYVVDRDAVILELEGDLPGAEPVRFKGSGKGPFFGVTYSQYTGEWGTGIAPFSESIWRWDTHPAVTTIQHDMLIVDAKGEGVGVGIKPFTQFGEGWKTSPEKWSSVSPAEMASKLKQLQAVADPAIVRVTLGLRSPKASNPAVMRRQMQMEDEDGSGDSGTERTVSGLLVGKDRVVVLAALSPKITARLERIRVYAGKEVIDAKFNASLKDYGAFVATLSKPAPGSVTLSTAPLTDNRMTLLLRADVTIRGEQRSSYFDHERLLWFETGPKRRTYARLYSSQEGIFLFDLKNQLVTLPMSLREGPTLERGGRSSRNEVMVPSTYLAEALADLGSSSDLANVPLSEAEETRVGWLGVELQPLDKDLARANNVADQTQDGQSGALVTYVYPGSPAAKAGVEGGMILLRIKTPSKPAPIDVRVDDDRNRQSFPWEQLDQVTDRFFDRVPVPWPAVDNSINRLITDLGFGTKFTLEYVANGQLKSAAFTVEGSPKHYESAARYKSEALGLTVRDVTYEVRHYLQRKDDEPGVVIGKLEPGSRASISGLKPYELITHINDQPVSTVKDFENLTQAGGELRLSIKRMSKGRIVTIRPAN